MLKLEIQNKNGAFAATGKNQPKKSESHPTGGHPLGEKTKRHNCFCRPYPPIANNQLADKLKEFLEEKVK
jgi:hypothetical protein